MATQKKTIRDHDSSLPFCTAFRARFVYVSDMAKTLQTERPAILASWEFDKIALSFGLDPDVCCAQNGACPARGVLKKGGFKTDANMRESLLGYQGPLVSGEPSNPSNHTCPLYCNDVKREPQALNQLELDDEVVSHGLEHNPEALKVVPNCARSSDSCLQNEGPSM